MAPAPPPAAEPLTQLVRPLQASGEHNPRHFDKYIFQLPIPLYDPGNAEHRQLAELASTPKTPPPLSNCQLACPPRPSGGG